MKKKLILIFTILLLFGCSKNNTANDNTINDTLKEDSIPEYIDNNPIKIGIYDNNEIVTEYETYFKNSTDLGAFDIYYTNIDVVEHNRTKINWTKYYNEYENIENYKTGFYITFEADGNKIESLILDSNATYSLSPYIFVYLYDDVNQPDYTWYSHITPENENENTIFSSIKLFLASGENNIISPIYLTAFTYDDDDFDENGHYRGNSSYTIKIVHKQ